MYSTSIQMSHGIKNKFKPRGQEYKHWKKKSKIFIN